MTPRVVLDCMVLFAQAIHPSFVTPTFDLILCGDVELVLSSYVVSELRDVMERESIRRRFPNLTEPRADAFLRDLRTLGIHIDSVPSRFELSADPKDAPYVDLAIAVGAAFLVTRDHHLLDLRDDPRLAQAAPGLRIVTPAQLAAHFRPLDEYGFSP